MDEAGRVMSDVIAHNSLVGARETGKQPEQALELFDLMRQNQSKP